MPIASGEISSTPESVKKVVDRLQQDVRTSTDTVGYQFVTVTSPTTPNTDWVIPTTLLPQNPENIYYQVVDYKCLTAPATTPCVYRDTSTTRKPWGIGYVVLRCNVASVSIVLKLFIPR